MSKENKLLARPNKHSSVKKIIAVVSGKGGVGKSMVTSLLASMMNKRGYKTGILDADITGPSIPKMFGIKEKGQGTDEGLIPAASKNNVKIMSSHLLLENDNDPIVWRGTLISSLVTQFWTDVIWEDVDYLFVDMPPGTGDVPLTVFQSIGVDGIIIVTSPQELVSMIVEKAVKMANMMDIPVLGLVENMSYVMCPDCGKKIEVFGPSNVENIASKFNLDVLAKMPIDYKLALLADKGNIEDAEVDYLDKALDLFENLAVEVTNFALPILNNEIIEKAGEAKSLYIYNVVKDMVVGGHKEEINSHDDFYNALIKNNVKYVITNQIERSLCDKIEANKMEVFIGEAGNPIDAINHYIDVKYAKFSKNCSGNCASCGEDCGAKK
ncbi:MAG: Mrp/NBP35 family ATP-binding protein [Bacilli bacterium]|nr:Mrp/NBP35 family ATP-binding protein [Bacilli bacterium]